MPQFQGTFLFDLSFSPYLLLVAAAAFVVWLFWRYGTLTILAYAYLLRFPLLNAAAMVGLVVAAKGGARSLLGNLFDVPRPLGMLLLSLAAFLNAWTVMLTWKLVVRHGDARFNLSSFTRHQFKGSDRVRRWEVVLYGALALPLVIYAIAYTIPRNRPHVSTVWIIAGAVLGLLFARLILWVIERIPSARSEMKGRAANRYGADPEGAWRGYFERRGGRVVLLPGHGTAAAMFGVTLVFYFVTGVWKWARLGEEPFFPTLGYVMLILMLLCWGLSGAAFFLDRFRVPVILPLLALFLLTALPPWSDHYYALADRGAGAPARGAAVTCPLPRPSPQPCSPASPQPSPQASPAQATGRPVIVVAANGGGIQAGAWAARVLTELQRKFKDEFGGKVSVVSSVSGGSIGAMYFVNGYEGGRPPTEEKLNRIVEQAEASSLDEVAWGLAFPDLIRAFTSLGGKWDRGSALEYSFSHEDRSGGVGVPLSAWAGEVAAGRRPGSIFNATVSDTGQRIPLSTLGLPPCSVGEKTRARLYDGLGGRDIAVVTAARLSATFPYVSPAARANLGSWTGAQPHLVDGGYYDNYGITSLVEWLDYELSRPGSDIGRVLIVEIHGAPTVDPEADEKRQEDQEKRAGYKFASDRGWLYQFYAPLGTLLHVRDTGQLSNNRVQLRLLIDKWSGDSGGRPVPITDVVFECNLSDTPTSWHLNRQDKARIKSSWDAVSNNPTEQKSLTNRNEGGLDIVEKFIKGCP